LAAKVSLIKLEGEKEKEKIDEKPIPDEKAKKLANG
jgi:hypothetical protein